MNGGYLMSRDVTVSPGNENLKRILDYLKISYWLTDLNYVLLDVNETFLELAGASRKNLIGRDMRTLISAEEIEIVKHYNNLLTEGKESVQFELYVYGPQRKKKIPVLYHLSMNSDEHGQPATVNALLMDISEQKKIRDELFHFKRQVRRNELQTKMIGTGKKMEAVFETILRCAEVDSSVLIMGETGVGKEVAARSIHAQSHRKDNPFVTVNCGALPETLLESELFGHVKGAFTGATSNRAGLFSEAHEGTLFLDEIGELNKAMQVKLLRVLQEGEVRPVGSDRSRNVEVRIICATNRNLQVFAQQGQFRMDLYYRVAVIPLVIPPLRDRPQDTLKLADYFIHKHQKKDGRDLKTLTLITQQLLRRYHWPGNIRELENAIEHALAMSRSSEITPECFPLQILAPETGPPAAEQNDGLRMMPSRKTKNQAREYRRLNEALSRHGGNLTAAAEELGISRVTLWRKRKKYDL